MYDVVIAGAGNGGLTAALTSAEKGLKTLLIEQHNLPGGFASSLTRGRFEFEPSLHEPCDIGPENNPGSLGQLFKRLNLDVDWARVPEAFRLITTDDPEGNLDIAMPFGVDAFTEKMEELVPGSKPSMNDFFRLSQEILDGLNYLGESKGHPDKDHLIKTFPNFLRTAPYSLAQVEKVLKIPPKARRILNAYWCYLGVPASRLNFTIYGAMILKYLDKGVFIPRGRSHEISSAFMDRFQKLGGDVWYNTKVEKLLVREGRVRGVRTSRGEVETRHVVSNIPRHVVFGSLLDPADAAPEIELRGANVRRPGGQGYVLYLGLDKSPEELGLKEYSYFIYPSMDTDALYRGLSAIDTNRIQATVCLNNAVPDCSPPGTTIMSFTTLFTDQSWDAVKPEEYFRVKDRIADRIISDFEKATGLSIRDSIEESLVASPATFARYTGAYNGSIYGYEAEAWDSLLPRMMMMDEDYRIKGLRFCGGHAFRLHGYSSSYLSGETAALLTFRDIKE